MIKIHRMHFKGRLLGVLMFCFISGFIHAQSFKAGLVAGLTSCQVDGDQLSGYNKPGPVAGMYVYRSIGKNVDLQMEMAYIQKGARLTPKPQNGNQFRLIRLHYVEVPVTARYKNGNFGYEAGLSFGTLLVSYVGTEFGETPVSAINPPFFKTEYAIHAGMGMRISDRWSTFWRISYSILPVRDFPGGRTMLSRAGQYNNVLHFTLRYLISKPEPVKEPEPKI